jgi:acyl carrier protein
MADGAFLATPNKVAEIVQGLLAKRGVTHAIEVTQNLQEAGLTSLDMVNLMLAVEAEFDIEIPGAMMRPENFRSVEAIDAVVAKVLGG